MNAETVMVVGLGSGTVLMVTSLVGLLMYVGMSDMAGSLGVGFADLSASLHVALAQRDVACTIPVEVGNSGNTIIVSGWGERQTVVMDTPVRPGRYVMQLVSQESAGAA